MADENQVPQEEVKETPAVQRQKAPVKKQVPVKSSVEGKQEHHVQIDYKGDNLHALNHIHVLSPGLNTMPASLWEESQKHPSIQQMIKNQMIHVVGESH